MSEWPKLFHPARIEHVPAGEDDDGAPLFEDRLVVDRTVTVEGYQVQPGTWEGCAAWCGGTQVMYPDGDRGVAVGSLDPDRIALLGDYAMRDDDGFVVERADGFPQRYLAA